MKTIEAVNALVALNSIMQSGRLVPSRFAYASVINRKRLAEVAEAFEAGRKALLQKYGEKDGEGQLVEKDGNFVLTDQPAFIAEFTELCDGVTDVNLHAVALEAFPAEISVSEMDALLPLVQENVA